MRLLHRDVEFDLVVRGQVICKYKLKYSLTYIIPSVPLTRNRERPTFLFVCFFFFWGYEDNSKKSATLPRIFYDKNMFRNQMSTSTAHTRATP